MISWSCVLNSETQYFPCGPFYKVVLTSHTSAVQMVNLGKPKAAWSSVFDLLDTSCIIYDFIPLHSFTIFMADPSGSIKRKTNRKTKQNNIKHYKFSSNLPWRMMALYV